MPRPIEPVLDSIFYSNLKRSGVGNDEMDDSVPRSKDWDPFASTDTFMGEERESDDDDDDDDDTKTSRRANLDNFGDKKAKPFGSEDDDVEDDVNEFFQGGDKERGGGTGGYNDPSESKKESRRSRQAAGTREEMELGLRGDCQACVGTGEIYAGEPCPVCRGTGNASGQPDNQPPQTSWVPPNYQSAIHTAPGGGAHGPYRIEDSGGSYRVVNDNGETKGTHDTYDEAREQQKALYVNVPEAQEQAKQDEKSKSSRRRLVDSNILYTPRHADKNDGSVTGLSFTPPSKVRGSWSCNDCGADDLGVHDLNGHAQAHLQTTHRSAGYDLFL